MLKWIIPDSATQARHIFRSQVKAFALLSTVLPSGAISHARMPSQSTWDGRPQKKHPDETSPANGSPDALASGEAGKDPSRAPSLGIGGITRNPQGRKGPIPQTRQSPWEGCVGLGGRKGRRRVGAGALRLPDPSGRKLRTQTPNTGSIPGQNRCTSLQLSALF